jgi:hypothetical protein
MELAGAQYPHRSINLSFQSRHNHEERLRAAREQRAVVKEDIVNCPQCGWPGIGEMPAGVRLVKQSGKSVLIGHLAYYRMNSVLCSVCADMMCAVAARPWFVEAHDEYLDQVKVKKHILHGI